MKRLLWFAAFFAMLTVFAFSVLTADAVSAGDTVEVEHPRFDITIGTHKVDTRDAKYPIIVYNDVTYLPVSDMQNGDSYNYMECLGIVCGEDLSYDRYKKLFVRNMWFERNIPDKVDYVKADGIGNGMKAVVSENDRVIANNFGKISEIILENYPILEMNGVYYLPMTYDVACTGLGLSMKFSSENGLEMSRTQIPQRIVSVPSFDVTLNGVKYRNEVAKYPFFMYNNIVFMPLTDGMCDFMGIKFAHYDADEDEFERIIVGNKAERNEDADFDYIKAGDVLSMALAEPFDGELYVNGWGTRWHTYGMEYSPMMLGKVYYIPLTWQIAHDHFGWEYSFDGKNGLVLDCRNTDKAEADF